MQLVLDEHEFTLYRPEMLLLVIEERLTYWKVRAGIAEKLKHWHMAARAWQEYAFMPGGLSKGRKSICTS